MPGVPRELVEHALNVDPKAKIVKQPLRQFDEPKRKAIASELHRLENTGFIREIKTSSWVSNPVIVPKKNTDVQRVCVDYTSLNKHYPKDPFPLPRIDQIIDSTAGCARLSFLDAYFGYNHIKWKKEDEEKTAFITPYGVFCYQVMPFGLKKCRSNLSMDDAKLPRKPNRMQHPSLHRRRSHHYKKRRILNQRLGRNDRQPKQVQA
jgi:hypothetical protein